MATPKKDEKKTEAATDATTEVKAPTFKPVIIKHVSMPTLKLMPNMPVYVKILEKMFLGKVQPAKEGEAEKKPPTILNVLNHVVNKAGTALETDGEVMQLVAGKVLESELRETYPDDGYVNRFFAIEKGKKKGTTDRGYFTYGVGEIADPAKAQDAAK